MLCLISNIIWGVYLNRLMYLNIEKKNVFLILCIALVSHPILSESLHFSSCFFKDSLPKAQSTD